MSAERAARRTRVLFIHQNFPGQFRAIVAAMSDDPGYSVMTIGKEGCPKMPGVKTLTYRLHREPFERTHTYTKPYESGILHGQAVLRVLQKLHNFGWAPDVVIAHPGWGESLFIKDVFPNAKVIHFCEYFYHSQGCDAGFDPEFPLTVDDRARIRARNALHLMNLEFCDFAVSPTRWQKSLHPKAYQSKIALIHEGVDTEAIRADPNAVFLLPSGRALRKGDPVVTYVSRNLEPYRGFHLFVRSLPKILAENPQCEVVIVGGDGVSYGSSPPGGGSWREYMLREIRLDSRRVHFLGTISVQRYRTLLQVSAAHIYLTYPFVLSWSMLEAMAAGCLLIGSDTAPVREVLTHGKSGLLVDFFSTDAISNAVCDALQQPMKFVALRQNAAEVVRRDYSVRNGVIGYRDLVARALSSTR